MLRKAKWCLDEKQLSIFMKNWTIVLGNLVTNPLREGVVHTKKNFNVGIDWFVKTRTSNYHSCSKANCLVYF